VPLQQALAEYFELLAARLVADGRPDLGARLLAGIRGWRRPADTAKARSAERSTT
jgi:hypothetical protein